MWKEEWGVLRRIRRYLLHRRKVMCEFRSLFLFWWIHFETFISLRLSHATWDSEGMRSDFHFWHHSRKMCTKAGCSFVYLFIYYLSLKNSPAPVTGAAHQLTWITWSSMAGGSSQQEMCADGNHVTVEWSCCFLSSPPCSASTMSRSVARPGVELWAAVHGRKGNDAGLTWGNGANVKYAKLNGANWGKCQQTEADLSSVGHLVELKKEEKILWLRKAKLSYEIEIEYGTCEFQSAVRHTISSWQQCNVFVRSSRPGLNMSTSLWISTHACCLARVCSLL